MWKLTAKPQGPSLVCPLWVVIWFSAAAACVQKKQYNMNGTIDIVCVLLWLEAQLLKFFWTQYLFCAFVKFYIYILLCPFIFFLNSNIRKCTFAIGLLQVKFPNIWMSKTLALATDCFQKQGLCRATSGRAHGVHVVKPAHKIKWSRLRWVYERSSLFQASEYLWYNTFILFTFCG